MKLTLANLDETDVLFLRHCAVKCDYVGEMELLEIIHPYPKYTGNVVASLEAKREWGVQAFGYGKHGIPKCETFTALRDEACERLFNAGLLERQRYGVSYRYAITARGLKLLDA
jgi:hypothetical protein